MASITFPPLLTSHVDDCVQLHRAFKGFGCDTAAVINVLAHRNSTQRALIEEKYGVLYSDFNKRLTSKLSGKLETAVLLWMPEPATRDAVVLRHALSGDSICVDAATEVICSRTPPQLHSIKLIYHSRFGSSLEYDIAQRTSGDLQTILLACVATQRLRYEGMGVDRSTVERDAKALFIKAGEKKMVTDEKVFIQIFVERSRPHLAAVNHHYHTVYGSSLKRVVKSKTSGKFELALLTILHCSVNPAQYFAKVLYKSMKGLGTNERTLTRVIVTRAEIDMQFIKAEYLKKYKRSLNNAVHSDTSGHYRTFLLSLIGP